MLVDPNTVFHRVYIIGAFDKVESHRIRTAKKDSMQEALEGAGAQAAGSTSDTLVTPRKEVLKATLEEIQKVAVAGHELTIYYTGHGGGGPFYGGSDLENEDDEEYEEHININEAHSLRDDELAAWLAGFAPGVSITLLFDSCFSGGFAGGSTDVQENNSVNVIGAGTTCPLSGTTVTSDSIRGISGEADYDSNGIVTAVELEGFLLAKGWDIRAPYDDSRDMNVREQLETWWNGAEVSHPDGVTSDTAPGETKKGATVAVTDNFKTVTGANVKILDSDGKVVAEGKTEVRGGKSARAYFDLAPGTYTVKVEWQEDGGPKKTGEDTFEVSATRDRNEKVVEVDEEGGDSSAQESTSVQGACATWCAGEGSPLCRRQCEATASATGSVSETAGSVRGDDGGTVGQTTRQGGVTSGIGRPHFSGESFPVAVGIPAHNMAIFLTRAINIFGTSPIDENTAPVNIARGRTSVATSSGSTNTVSCATPLTIGPSSSGSVFFELFPTCRLIDGSFSSDIAVDFGDIGLPNSFFYGDANGWSATGTGASKAEGTHVSTVTPPASKGLSPCVLNFTVVVDDASTDITVTINSVSGCT